MRQRSRSRAAVILLLSTLGLVCGCGEQSGPSTPFGEASVHFEQNATDGDIEVVFEVDGGDEGLAKLTVVSPDGHTVVNFTAPDASTLGIRQFHFESPEPADVASLKSAYPQGVYTFAGETVGGDKLHGESKLNHKLPATTEFVQPAADALGVGVEDLEITWTYVKDLAAYVIEIEQDELHISLTAKLPGSEARFSMPDGFLLPGTEYNLNIGTVNEDGNISFVETTFTTAAQEE